MKRSLRSPRTHRLALTVVLCAGLAACGFGSDSPGSATDPTGDTPVEQTPSTPAVVVSGQVYASNVSGAQVALFAADAQGRQTGTALAGTSTDAQGRYTLTLTALPAGPVLLVASGGTYVSEADGTPQTLGTLATLVAQLVGSANTVQINPLTNTIAAAAAQLLAAEPGTALATALARATSAVNTLFGLGALTADPAQVAADPAATAGDAWLLAALAGTLEQLRANSGLVAAALYDALRDDAADGKLDGLNGGSSIPLGSTGTLAASLFTTQWSGAANAYGSSRPQYANATASISGALQSAAQAAGIAIGSSGSIAPLLTQAGGVQLYFAARKDGLVVLDMSNPAQPVPTRLSAIDDAVMLNTKVSPPTGYFGSLDGIVINPTPINTPSGAKVFAVLYSYNSSTVVIANLTDGVVSSAVPLNIKNSLFFSGATARIAGGIADGKRGLIWLATGDGLMGLDPSQPSGAVTLIAQPAGTQINENLGGDPAKDIVYSPDYDNQGLVIFNLAEAKAYVMNGSDWIASVGSFASGGREVDGVSLDSQYQVSVMTLEGGGTVGVMAYATPSGATTPQGSLPATTRFVAYGTGGSFAGSAIDPVSHTGLFVGEGTQLGVGVLDDPAGASWAGFSRFVRTGSSSYRFEPHDPHTVGAFNVGGKPYGFVLQGSQAPYKIGVIDMQAWLAAPVSGNVLVSDPLADPGIVKLLSY